MRWSRERSQAIQPEADPLLAGASSPALERYREERARQVKRENDEREALLLDAAELAAALSRIARVFRERAEAIERTHGPEVGGEIREMIDEAEREWEKAPGPTEVRDVEG